MLDREIASSLAELGSRGDELEDVVVAGRIPHLDELFDCLRRRSERGAIDDPRAGDLA